MRTKFGKSVSIDNPYATFKNDRMGMEWRVLKTYQGFDKEKQNPYARWFVAAKSPMTYDSWEMGDTYMCEILRYGYLTQATEEWEEEYAERH